MAINSALEDRRIWIGGGAVTGVVLAAASWLFVISPEMSSTSGLRTQQSNEQSQNITQQGKVNKLKDLSQNIGGLTANLNQAVTALPPDNNLDDFTRQLNAEATKTGVRIVSITVGSVVSAGKATATSANAAGKLYSIPVTIVTEGVQTVQLAFVKAIQSDARSALVTSTALQPLLTSDTASLDRGASMTTQLAVFSAPLTPAARTELEDQLSGNVTK